MAPVLSQHAMTSMFTFLMSPMLMKSSTCNDFNAHIPYVTNANEVFNMQWHQCSRLLSLMTLSVSLQLGHMHSSVAKTYCYRKPKTELFAFYRRCLQTLQSFSLCIFILEGYFLSLVSRPHPLTRRNSLVNPVEFPGLAHAFPTVSPSNVRNILL